MNSLYSNIMIEDLNKRIKKGRIVALLPLVIVVPIFVLLSIFAEMETKVLFIILGTLDLLIFDYIFIFQLIENIIKPKDMIKHIVNMLSASKSIASGKVKSISKPMTLKKNVHIVEIEMSKEYEHHRMYFNIDLNECNIKENDEINVVLVNNFITEYEVIKND